MTKRENHATFASTQWTTEKAEPRRAELKQITALMLLLMEPKQMVKRVKRLTKKTKRVTKMAKQTTMVMVKMVIRLMHEEEDYRVTRIKMETLLEWTAILTTKTIRMIVSSSPEMMSKMTRETIIRTTQSRMIIVR